LILRLFLPFTVHRSLFTVYAFEFFDLLFVLNLITVDGWRSWVFVAQLVKIKV